MSKLTVLCGNSQINLTDNDYLASGGEAKIYTKGNLAFRIQHDPSTLPPLAKLEELMHIQSNYVIKPIEFIRNPKSNTEIGFTMQYLRETEPAVKYFATTYRKSVGFGTNDSWSLSQQILETVQSVHDDHCLIVDLNPMNVLIPNSNRHVGYFIDTASWKTPTYPATAIMDSISDPLVKGGNFTEMSDWYSYATLTFQLLTTIHPYKGIHPQYKADWQTRKKQLASVFDKGVILPPSTIPFSTIPIRQLEWYKAIFMRGERSVPPSATSSAIIPVPAVAVMPLNNKGNFKVEEYMQFSHTIYEAFAYGGTEFFSGEDGIYDKADTLRYKKQHKKARLFLLPTSSPIVLIVGELTHDRIYLYTLDGKLIQEEDCLGAFVKYNILYLRHTDCISSNRFIIYGDRIIRNTEKVEDVSVNTTKLFDGVIVQSLLNQTFISLPLSNGYTRVIQIKELANLRIIDAKGMEDTVILISEVKGVFKRHVLLFQDIENNDIYDYRNVADVTYAGINATAVPRGPKIIYENDSVEVFTTISNTRVLTDVPLDSGMSLYFYNGVKFINNTTIYKFSMK